MMDHEHMCGWCVEDDISSVASSIHSLHAYEEILMVSRTASKEFRQKKRSMGPPPVRLTTGLGYRRRNKLVDDIMKDYNGLENGRADDNDDTSVSNDVMSQGHIFGDESKDKEYNEKYGDLDDIAYDYANESYELEYLERSYTDKMLLNDNKNDAIGEKGHDGNEVASKRCCTIC